MTEFALYNLETAPEAAKPLFEESIKAFGMIPNLHAVMAESPELLESYQAAHTLFQQTSFNADELTVVWQSINVENNCHYCIPAHTAIAEMMGVDASICESIKSDTPLTNKKLEALRVTTLAMIRQRGVITDEEVQHFFDSGYSNKQLLEIVLGISQKIMSNYTNHLAKTPVDEPFKKYI